VQDLFVTDCYIFMDNRYEMKTTDHLGFQLYRIWRLHKFQQKQWIITMVNKDFVPWRKMSLSGVFF